MSILIKGLKMPENGTYLDLVITADGKVCCYDHEGVSVAEAVELPDYPMEGEIDKWWERNETINAARNKE